MSTKVVGQTIDYRWWKENRGTIDPFHEEILKKMAIDHIKSMTDKGYTCGDLSANLSKADSNETIEYKGWWEVKEA